MICHQPRFSLKFQEMKKPPFGGGRFLIWPDVNAMKLQLQVFKWKHWDQGHRAPRGSSRASSLEFTSPKMGANHPTLHCSWWVEKPNLNKHIRQKWLHLPQKFGVNMKNIWVIWLATTTHRSPTSYPPIWGASLRCFQEASCSGGCCLQYDHDRIE